MESNFRIAKAVQMACIEAAIRAYEDAGLSGLCHEGRWECAIDAIRSVALRPLIDISTNEVPDCS